MVICVISPFASRLLEQLLEREREYQTVLQQVLEEREQEIRLLRLRAEPAGVSSSAATSFTLSFIDKLPNVYSRMNEFGKLLPPAGTESHCQTHTNRQAAQLSLLVWMVCSTYSFGGGAEHTVGADAAGSVCPCWLFDVLSVCPDPKGPCSLVWQMCPHHRVVQRHRGVHLHGDMRTQS